MKYRSPSGVAQHADTPAEQVRLRARGWTPVEDEPAESAVQLAEASAEAPTEPAPESTEDTGPRKSAGKSAKK